MKYKFFAIATFVGWVIFCFGDLFEEAWSADGLLIAMTFYGGIMIGLSIALYDFLKGQMCPMKVSETLIATGVMIITDVVIAGIIAILFETELWFIDQETGGWEHLLNGIEYFVYPIFSIIESILVFWIYNGIMAVVVSIIRKKNVSAE